MWVPWGIDETQTVYDITGKYPAIRGHDYINESSNIRENQLIIEWWKSGGIPTLMWHWGAPSTGEGYENSKKEINIDSCFIPGTKQYTAMWSDLKRIYNSDLVITRDELPDIMDCLNVKAEHDSIEIRAGASSADIRLKQVLVVK